MDNETKKNYAQLIAKAWVDPSLKERLLNNPADVLKEHGVTLPEGVEAKFIQDTDKVKHFILPSKPDDKDIAPEKVVACMET